MHTQPEQTDIAAPIVGTGIDIAKKTLIEVQVISRSLNTIRVSGYNAAEEFRLAVMIDSPDTRVSLLEAMEKELEAVADALRRVRAALGSKPKRPALVAEQAI